MSGQQEVCWRLKNTVSTKRAKDTFQNHSTYPCGHGSLICSLWRAVLWHTSMTGSLIPRFKIHDFYETYKIHHTCTTTRIWAMNSWASLVLSGNGLSVLHLKLLLLDNNRPTSVYKRYKFKFQPIQGEFNGKALKEVP